MTFNEILSELRERASSNRAQGDSFERLMVGFFRTDPEYRALFDQVWRWTDWPEHDGPDTGIDLVARERDTGRLWAIQCKFIDPTHTLHKSDIDSFFTASGKSEFGHRLIVSTTDNWSANAEAALINQQIPVDRLRFQDLAHRPIDWSVFSWHAPDSLRRLPQRSLRPYQRDAVKVVVEGLSTDDRGQLIMACGTGKTYTALKIMETLVSPGGAALFLVPSLALLAQTLHAWTADAEQPLRCFAVCSDAQVGRRARDGEDIAIHDLAYPATTDPNSLSREIGQRSSDRVTVIFATYQSLPVIHKAQQMGLAPFDLIIADEAHRTAGYTLADEDPSPFMLVHDDAWIQSHRRLYMTATPKLYTTNVKQKAAEKSVVVASMDDPARFGHELYRLDFSTAIELGILADYRVLILAVPQSEAREWQEIQNADVEIDINDAGKVRGMWKALAKDFGSGDPVVQADPQPMRRAIAFTQNIKISKQAQQLINLLANSGDEPSVPRWPLSARHVDGTHPMPERQSALDWLTESRNECRVLTNARCLAEGVDVPALDAVIFLNPRKSRIDVAQAVGRVMRRPSNGTKQYGYVILPVVVADNVPPEEALSQNKPFQVVWEVLNALRALDDRFDAIVNQIDLNTHLPPQIDVIGGGRTGSESDDGVQETTEQIRWALASPLEKAIYAKIVEKVGSRKYWEDWATDIAQIAASHRQHLEALLASPDRGPRKAFESLVETLRNTLHPDLSPDDVMDLISQQLLTKPVFDALFPDVAFEALNPVSKALQEATMVIGGPALAAEVRTLEPFYESVRRRVQDLDNLRARQRLLIELYDTFFRRAFPRQQEKNGIVYTPLPVVDFILRSADALLLQEFGRGLADEGVHVLDPFTGTGSFLVQLLQNHSLLPSTRLTAKYQHELHANEIMLLAYYIATVNIEQAYRDRSGDYIEFPGIVWTDTFQMTESHHGFLQTLFPENDIRASRQKEAPITVIVGNPPYSGVQKSANQNNKKDDYPVLDERVRKTYVETSRQNNKNSVYDSYIRAFRWASDRIGTQGIVGFVTNAGWLTGRSTDGFRSALEQEFSKVYVINLRGDQLHSVGEKSRKEGGKVFDSGSRQPIAITFS